ncbi:MAG TPA: anhydro-N-acetylmuramic acid kinase [Saprospiraceae bacterium]|nr:anhydro-N-acetylmuramic acid kinase [Saprospiraceae bacterium]
MQHTNSLRVIGLMSGTSLDGLDIAFVEFHEDSRLHFEWIDVETIAYSGEWKAKLHEAFFSTPESLGLLNEAYGRWLGEQTLAFMQKNRIQADLIASHGHTIFHRPHEHYTLQIGSGKAIREITGVPVVCNFREQDVRMGGQGAPLVPVGDQLLFGDYEWCLNLGGFANISWAENGLRKACDIGPCNMLLNTICTRLSMDYDAQGRIGRTGQVLSELLERWNALGFYSLEHPKSLGREWFEEHFSKDVLNPTTQPRDLLATAYRHIAFQVHRFIEQRHKLTSYPSERSRVLVTGGGAHNSFLLQLLAQCSKGSLHYEVPDERLVDYKEALVFALLAYLRWTGKPNVLASVTGAPADHSSGEIFS